VPGDRGGAALAIQGEAVEEPSTLPVARVHSVAGKHPRGTPRRRCARDEEQNTPCHRRRSESHGRAHARRGGLSAPLDKSDKTDRDRCPVQETAVARRVAPRSGHHHRGAEHVARREEAPRRR